jgi:hypothetical protein
MDRSMLDLESLRRILEKTGQDVREAAAIVRVAERKAALPNELFGSSS